MEKNMNKKSNRELKTSNFTVPLTKSMLQEMARLKIEKDINWSALLRDFAKQKIEELNEAK